MYLRLGFLFYEVGKSFFSSRGGCENQEDSRECFVNCKALCQPGAQTGRRWTVDSGHHPP